MQKFSRGTGEVGISILRGQVAMSANGLGCHTLERGEGANSISRVGARVQGKDSPTTELSSQKCQHFWAERCGTRDGEKDAYRLVKRKTRKLCQEEVAGMPWSEPWGGEEESLGKAEPFLPQMLLLLHFSQKCQETFREGR